jgi:hypothetical protein
MKVKVTVLVMALIVAASCANAPKDVNKATNISNAAAPANANANQSTAPAAPKSAKQNLEGVIGLVVLDESYKGKEPLRLYGQDGSLSQEFKPAAAPADLKPLVVDAKAGALVMKCAGQDDSRYEVVVNEDTGARKFVKKDDKAFRFETWERYLLQIAAVKFDDGANKVLDLPQGNRKNVLVPMQSTVFTPIQVKGEWLKIEWETEAGKGLKDSGWIRWRDGNALLIEIIPATPTK